MDYNELNEYILHYIEADKTKSAIMLTGIWGTGKSHYISNILAPFLNKEKNDNCIIVSLYGLKDISEISKCIFLEIKLKALQVRKDNSKIRKWIYKANSFFQKNKEVAKSGKLIAKSLIKGVTGFFGIDLSVSGEDLNQLYESADLCGKLIILEDIERSQIGILQLLGYVNSLVEQDGVKVLLVANEDEILDYDEINNKDEKGIERVLTEQSLIYLKTKEKTVSDTITFVGDYYLAIKSIISESFYEQLSAFLNDNEIGEIQKELISSGDGNLRTFIYACQKTSDILSLIDENVDFEIKRTIFYSIILFSNKIKTEIFPKWEGTDYLSTELGNNQYPLYYFCYEYIRWQSFNKSSVQDTIAEHKKLKTYQNQKHDPDLMIIFNYFTYPEETVKSALFNTEHKLGEPNTIALNEYGRLVYYFIKCNTILDFDYLPSKSRMLSNLCADGAEIDGDILFLSVGEFDTENEKKQFDEFRDDILSAIHNAANKKFEFDYNSDSISEFYKDVAKNKYEIRSNHRFISGFDMEKLLSMILNCSAEQIHDFRGILFAVYRDAPSGTYLEQDVEFMLELKTRIETIISDNCPITDRIILLQLQYLCENLQRFANQLS